MRTLQIIITSFFGGLALWTEFKSIKESALFTAWLDSFPFWTLFVLTVVLIVMNIRQYSSNMRIISFLPVWLCVIFLSTIIWHQQKIKKLDNSPTKFSASTYDIGSDGGFILDFKVNGHLKAEKRDHWTITYYWGDYSQNHDTVNLNISLDLKLGRQAVLTDESLHFLGDSIKFVVFRP